MATTQDVYAEQLSAVPEIAELGNVFKSSPPVELTESETEYVVRCVKHVFPQHVVFQVRTTDNVLWIGNSGQVNNVPTVLNWNSPQYSSQSSNDLS